MEKFSLPFPFHFPLLFSWIRDRNTANSRLLFSFSGAKLVQQRVRARMSQKYKGRWHIPPFCETSYFTSLSLFVNGTSFAPSLTLNLERQSKNPTFLLRAMCEELLEKYAWIREKKALKCPKTFPHFPHGSLGRKLLELSCMEARV